MYRTAEVTTHEAAGFERTGLVAVLDWLRDDWSLERPVIITNEKLDHQIATIEGLGLTRRFDHDRDNDMYRSHAYA